MSSLSDVKPNFFIIGAPKCGTTALSEYLSIHPEVHFSRPKEPKFFHTDFRQAHRDTLTLENYLHCFDPGEMRRCRAVGEGTVWYLYSKIAVRNILDYNPAARFIVLLRNPVDLAHSLHSQLLFGGNEDVDEFEAAWHLQTERRRGRHIPLGCPDPRVLQYGSVAKLGEQIERLYELVPRDRVKIFFQEDFLREPLRLYNQALEFLGLPGDGRSTFPFLNANRRVRFRRLSRLFFLGSVVKRKLGLRRSLGLWSIVSPLLSNVERRPPLKAELRSELQSYFDEDLGKLSNLVDRDLSSWTPAAPVADAPLELR